VISETATGQQRHQGFTGFLGAVLSFVGIFLYAMVVWRFRQNDEQSTRLLAQMEETRDAELRAAALSERQRLAREMHDVLAHSLSGLLVQLEGARLLAVSDPADGRLAATIDRAHQLAKSGLDEARRAIGMLRDDELPGPDRLAALTRSFAADTGLPCEYAQTGEPVELRPAVKLALYRVTQEALTNVRKHAHPDRVEVGLEYLRDGVSLAVEDFSALQDKPAPAPGGEASGGGYGLTGMRERAELLGGTLTAAPTGSGFRVALRVPA
jgi:signal transduction histidine kinase